MIPPPKIPTELLQDFTCNGNIPVEYSYSNDSHYRKCPVSFRKEVVDQWILDAQAKKINYYGNTDLYLYKALESFSIRDKKVGVLGSTSPWYESIVLAHGGIPTTIDYNKIISEDPRICTLTVEESKSQHLSFDALLSISSFEHDGLGRYGDPIQPDGDLRAIDEAKKMLRPGGVLFLAVPVGKDLLVWNAHRVYGEIRLKQLLSGWKTVHGIGFDEKYLHTYLDGTTYQPLFVCQK